MNSSKDALWRPALIVFLSNAAFMVVELVAGRIVAPHIGVSLYSWTTIIGVMLGGISLGNWLGGKWADRGATRNRLGAILIVCGLLVWSILPIMWAYGEYGLPGGGSVLQRMVIYFCAIFLLPSIALGFVSPMVIKLALNDLNTTGTTMGRIYAASSFGSIVGTFAAGFFLVSAYGSRAVIIGCGALLLAMGVLLGHWFGAQRVSLRAVAALLALLLPISTPTMARALPDTDANQDVKRFFAGPCLYETDYTCIRVRKEVYRDVEYTLLQLDRLVHSYTAIGKPDAFRYGYEMVEAEVGEFLVQRDGSLDVFIIGAGGYTLPIYFEEKYGDKAIVEVAEIDPTLVEVGHQHFGLKRNTRIKTHVWDARWFLAKEIAPDRKYSLILEDAVNDFSVPYHLATREFNDLVRKHLRDDGIYIINILDGSNMQFVGGVLRTLKQTYPHIYLVPNGRWIGIPNNTYLIMASPQPIDIAKLTSIDAGDNWLNTRDWLVTDAEVQPLLDNGTFLLTDDYVPTDTLLLPLFDAIAGK